jgi:arylsulfatase A-like enzyme
LRDETRHAFEVKPGQVVRLAVRDLGRIVELPMAATCRGGACAEPRFDARLVSHGSTRGLVSRQLGPRDLGRWSLERVRIPDELNDADATLELRVFVTATPTDLGELTTYWGAPLPLSESRGPRPNVLMISLDALRADRLGCYGNPRAISPHLDALAADGVRFADATTHAPWTTPSHMSLMTSQIPTKHGSNHGFGAFSQGRFPRLPDEAITLADTLRAKGYQTRALTGGGTLAGALGFDQGFDVFRDGKANFKTTERVYQQLLEWMSLSRQPWFLFWHTFEVHSPYTRLDYVKDVIAPEKYAALAEFVAPIHAEDGFPFTTTHEGFRDLLRELGVYERDVLVRLYDGGITQADRMVGRIIAALRKLDLYESTILVVLSDHGEEFGDHDPTRIYNGHCSTLYEEILHVPLILRVPGRYERGTVVKQQARLIDVAPTLLHVLGYEIPTGMQGRSLDAAVRGEATTDAPAVAESVCKGPEWKSLRGDGYKLLMTCAIEGEARSGITGPCESRRLFDLARDPGEQHDIAAAEPERVTEMERTLRAQLGSAPSATPTNEVQLDEGLKERLRALGYVE